MPTKTIPRIAYLLTLNVALGCSSGGDGPEHKCGNGIVESTEQCDDGRETAVCDVDCTPAVCGDNLTNGSAGEECDDGNVVNEDACLSTCALPTCGDGYVQAGMEACDDGDTLSNGEGACVADCSGVQACGDSQTTGTEVCDDGDTLSNGEGACVADCSGVQTCGDSQTTGTEVCDDGDTLNNGEGACVADCSGVQTCGDSQTTGTEVCDDGDTLSNGEGVCVADCSGVQRCGDSQTTGTEVCDDGDTLNNGEGACLADCSGVQTCGDSLTTGTEVCDDGDTLNNGEGACLADCSGVQMCGDSQTTGTEVCDDGDTLNNGEGACVADCSGVQTCGDSQTTGTETCDDGDTLDNGEGSCTANCLAVQICGNGNPEGTEGCDDGNLNNHDSCPDGAGGTCLSATCGDGFAWVQDGGSEECDDGNNDPTDSCLPTCSQATCGDGYVWNTDGGSEACDDGNGDNTDSCPDGVDGTCLVATCGDGHVWNTDGGSEACDDGNGDNTDSCPDGVDGTCLLAGQCLTQSDCLPGETCLSNGTCEPTAACGFEELTTSAVAKPNMLMVVDQSRSMQMCGWADPYLGECGAGGGFGQAPPCDTGPNPEDTVTRWNQALEAIQDIMTAQSNAINFGLSTYPEPEPDQVCPVNCNWWLCDGTSGVPGTVDVPVAQNTSSVINSLLASTVPGGSTPTAATLRNVITDPNGAGLDQAQGENVILLVTDGEATGETDIIKVCNPPACGPLDPETGPKVTDDCGYSCTRRCDNGETCEANHDCVSNVCRLGACYPAACGNDTLDNGDAGALNNNELGVDCGGPCPACPAGVQCSDNTDCLSGECSDNRCAAPACDDGKKNGDEMGIDCGGSCTANKCADGSGCTQDADCASDVCQGGECRVATCGDEATSGQETGIDCGGPDCGLCPDGEGCNNSTDCGSGFCDGGTNKCAKQYPACHDAVRNGTETDVDCGGDTCAPCPDTSYCEVNADCVSGTCGACQSASSPDDACAVNAALDQLYALDPDIRTYVVGFAFTEVNAELNCYTAHGRTSRLYDKAGNDQCAGVTTATCSNATNACYYEATDKETLSKAFSDIIMEVSTCEIPLADYPPNPDKIYVYLDLDTGSGRDLERLWYRDDWTYNSADNQIGLKAHVCQRIAGGEAELLVTFGCASGG